MKLAEKESLDRSGPGCAREPGRDSYRSKAKERRRGGPVDAKSPEAVDTASTEVAGEAVGAGVLPCHGDHAGRLRAVSGRDLPAVPSIRAQGTAGRRVGPVGAAPPHGPTRRPAVPWARIEGTAGRSRPETARRRPA